MLFEEIAPNVLKLDDHFLGPKQSWRAALTGKLNISNEVREWCSDTLSDGWKIGYYRLTQEIDIYDPASYDKMGLGAIHTTHSKGKTSFSIEIPAIHFATKADMILFILRWG